VALEYDARHSPTRRPIAKDSAARRVVVMHYGGLAMEGPRLTRNKTQELSVGGLPSHARLVGGPPIQLSPSDGCILEHPGYSGAPEYCLYSRRRPAERKVRSRRVADCACTNRRAAETSATTQRAADSKNRYPTSFQGFCPQGSSPLPNVILSSDIFIRNGWNKLKNVQRKCIKLTLNCC
jgi:hypothetical protein